MYWQAIHFFFALQGTKHRHPPPIAGQHMSTLEINGIHTLGATEFSSSPKSHVVHRSRSSTPSPASGTVATAASTATSLIQALWWWHMGVVLWPEVGVVRDNTFCGAAVFNRNIAGLAVLLSTPAAAGAIHSTTSTRSAWDTPIAMRPERKVGVLAIAEATAAAP